MITLIKKPIVSDLFCDKLSATLKIDKKYHEGVLLGANKHIQMGYAQKTHKSGYRFSMNLGLGGANENTALIQADPHACGNAFFRIEFNPHKLGSAGLSELRLRLNDILPFGYDSFIQNGICTRIDATVDIHHVEIDKLCFNYPNMLISKAYYKNGKTSRLQSYYMGGDNGQKLFCAYDKLEEIKKHNSKYSSNAIPLPNNPITRIEVRKKERIPITKLMAVPNQFKSLSIFSFHKMPNATWQFNLFIKAMRSDGARNVLLSLPKSIRKIYLKELGVAKSPFWNPEKIWEQWPDVISEIFYPADSYLNLPIQSIALD